MTEPQAPTLFDVIAWIESRDNKNALRFEPSVFDGLGKSQSISERAILDAIAAANACSFETACVLYSMSFGAVQIMAFNLYGPICQYRKSVIEYCNSLTDQQNAFMGLVASMKIGYTPQDLGQSAQARQTFAKRYNGDSAAYAPLIIASLDHFNLPVKK